MVEHKNDIRKGTQLPYLPHVIGVWRILMKLSYSHGKDYLYAAALLHDYVEDHVNREDRSVTLSWMVTQFGSLCVGIINELTSDEPIRQDNNGDKYYQIEENGVHREVNKIDYVNGKLMKMSSDALIIKLADIVDNLSDSDTMPKFPYRIRAHLRFIKDNMDAFAPRLSPDHRRLLDSIDRMLDTFYPTF
jgi:(p)ppGpp synthase/HD superfamily hydrolase